MDWTQLCEHWYQVCRRWCAVVRRFETCAYCHACFVFNWTWIRSRASIYFRCSKTMTPKHLQGHYRQTRFVLVAKATQRQQPRRWPFDRPRIRSRVHISRFRLRHAKVWQEISRTHTQRQKEKKNGRRHSCTVDDQKRKIQIYFLRNDTDASSPSEMKRESKSMWNDHPSCVWSNAIKAIRMGIILTQQNIFELKITPNQSAWRTN